LQHIVVQGIALVGRLIVSHNAAPRFSVSTSATLEVSVEQQWHCRAPILLFVLTVIWKLNEHLINVKTICSPTLEHASTRTARDRAFALPKRTAPPSRRWPGVRRPETREKLLAATHELLYERVGGPVSINEICERAGANVAMVKYCFGSKDAMMAALVDRVISGFVRELEKLDRRDLSAQEKLRIHIAEIVRNMCVILPIAC
jgi:hypothetical protein